MEKFKVFLKMLWPVLVAIIGFFIMYFAGALDCRGCNFFDLSWAPYMADWGWIGFGFVMIGLGYGGYRIMRAWMNVFKDVRKRTTYFVDEEQGSDVFGVGSFKKPYATTQKALNVSKRKDIIKNKKGHKYRRT